MGFLDKLTRKTTDKAADRMSDKIVNKIFGSKEEKKETVYVEKEAPVQQQPVEAAPATAPAEPDMNQLLDEQQKAFDDLEKTINESMKDAMGIAYNTKRCPECQALCMDAPVQCPYCGADLKAVKPLTPKELEELSNQ